MKALNRKEVLVNAKANGTLDSFKPLTRDEAFTKKALGLGGGGSGGESPFFIITGDARELDNSSDMALIVDQSPADILSAYNSGKIPMFVGRDSFKGITGLLTTSGTVDDDAVLLYFGTSWTLGDGKVNTMTIVVYTDKTVNGYGGHVHFLSQNV